MSTMTSVRCPRCGTSFRIAHTGPGTVATCPDCLEEFEAISLSVAPDAGDFRDAALDMLLNPSAEQSHDQTASPDDVQTGADGGDAPLSGDWESDAAPKKKLLERDYEFVVVCNICHTRQYLTDRDVGRTIKCPDCYTPIKVPRPPQRLRKPRNTTVKPLDDPWDDGLQLAAPPEPTVHQDLARDRLEAAERELNEAAAAGPSSAADPLRHAQELLRRAREEAAANETPRLPPRPFVDRVLTPFLDPTCWFRWLFLALLGYLLYAAGFSIWDLAHGGVMQQFVGLMLSIFCAGGGLAFLAGLSASMVAVIQDSAHGRDLIESWPNANLFDWLAEGFYVPIAGAAALALSVVCGQALWVTGAPPALAWLAFLALGLAGLWLSLPFLLLSLLENGSPFGFYSAPIVRSLTTAINGWITFQLLTAALAFAAFVLGAALLLEWLIVDVVVLVLLVGMTLLYARLLGRLAWVCDEANGNANESAAERSPTRTSPTDDDDRNDALPRAR